MTDKEILKALEYCNENVDLDCEECAICDLCIRQGYGKMCICINVITRQQSENEKLQELVDEMSDYFPCCVGCEGKTLEGKRTDKCIYLIDNTNYCTKKGIKNIADIRNENEELKAEIEGLKQALDKVSKIKQSEGGIG